MRAPLILFALAAPMLLSACGDPAPSYIDQAWVRLSPNKETPSAGYFVIHGGDAGTQLRGVLTDYALKVEMHESIDKDGMMTMQAVDRVDVPPKGTVAFMPGGKHLMLWGVNDTAISRGKMQLTFLMGNGDRLLVDAVIRKPEAAGAAAAAKPKGHEGH
ncbi:copper chaperone PCu(A)C [Sphingobium sp. AR-3-1]|uniref:Copper chaperone PCu(A)C n=1 Tax=Sphingobium psychrophilum TaxID=2728834 RepID=A0A7X9ZRK7_9SPHN|nr:copper chaperone PCu(A)C [Sphingobium psychrophilum]NML09592.1 copper chaperone PCu(A)C [Sphingobium psychrophilum]